MAENLKKSNSLFVRKVLRNYCLWENRKKILLPVCDAKKIPRPFLCFFTVPKVTFRTVPKVTVKGVIHRTIRHFYTVLNVTFRSPKKVIHRTKSHSNPYQKSHLTVPKVTFRARKRPKNAAPRGLLNIYKYIKYQLLLYL